MNNTLYQMPIEELYARALQEIKEISRDRRIAGIATTATERHMVLRSFALLSDDKAIGTEGYMHLDPVIRLLEEQLEVEPIDTFETFEGRHDPEEGAVGSVLTHHIMSDRGEEISVWLRRLCALQEMLQIVQARIAAERLINRRMQF